MANSENLTPLPKADRNSEIQKLSIRAFEAALPVDKFTFRSEPIEDAGVDGSLELKIDGTYTNLRAQVQLKGTDSEKTNQDGSISVEVNVSNLNYLLNGQSPIYILYVVPRNELYYAWARDERKRLDKLNPSWLEQKTINIRFENILTSDAVNQIHKRIKEESLLQREVSNILTSASNTENVLFSISPDTLEVTDPVKAREILITSGRLIVTAGYPEKVRSLSKILDNESEKSPLILLVRGYAEQSLGNYLESFALLSKAELRREELSEDDKQFLSVLQKNCDYLTGRITLEEFSSYLDDNKDKITGHFKQSFQINQLNYLLWNTKDPFQRPEIIKEFSELIQQILSDSTSSNVFKLYAKSVWLEVEGIEISSGLSRDIVAGEMRAKSGLDFNLSEIAQRYDNRFKKWLIDRTNAINEAEQLNHRGMIASLKHTSALITYNQLVSSYSLALIRRVPVEKFFEEDYKNAISSSTEISIKLLDDAIEIFQQIDNPEGELRAMMLKADFYDFVGRIEEAQKLAREVLPKAQALHYIRQVESAKDILAGNGLKARMKSSVKERSFEERQLENANWSDENVQFLAAQMVRICELPDDRYPAMEKEYFGIRKISQERLDWCRHIDLLQDLSHTRSTQTMYKTDPNRICVCKLYGYESLIRNPDYESLIPAFKQTYCKNCSSRSPIKQ